MNTLQCLRVNESVRVDITQANCASNHRCQEPNACPLDGCFSKQTLGKQADMDNTSYEANKKFGDRS